MFQSIESRMICTIVRVTYWDDSEPIPQVVHPFLPDGDTSEGLIVRDVGFGLWRWAYRPEQRF